MYLPETGPEPKRTSSVTGTGTETIILINKLPKPNRNF